MDPKGAEMWTKEGMHGRSAEKETSREGGTGRRKGEQRGEKHWRTVEKKESEGKKGRAEMEEREQGMNLD